MLHRKRLEVILDDEEMAFVKWMAKRDNVSVQTELKQFFYVEFEECKRLYIDEMRMEANDG